MTKGSAMEEVDGGHQIRPGWALKVLKCGESGRRGSPHVPYRQKGIPTWRGCKEFERKNKIEAEKFVSECLSKEQEYIL
jgi:hypothetical protein